MLWKIEKTLGNVAAVQADSVPESGVCIEFKNFQQADASILIYQDGKLEDVTINGCVFPCIYNKIRRTHIGCGNYRHIIAFDFIDPLGSTIGINSKSLYGQYVRESTTVEYFYTLLHYITYCDSREEQYSKLYKYIIDAGYQYIAKGSEVTEALNTLSFIKEFMPQLSNIENDTYLQGLKQKLNIRFREAQEVISNAECPK